MHILLLALLGWLYTSGGSAERNRYLTVRGKVVEITEEASRDVINAMSGKYLGQPVYGGPPYETRVTYKILPERVHVSG